MIEHGVLLLAAVALHEAWTMIEVTTFTDAEPKYIRRTGSTPPPPPAAQRAQRCSWCGSLSSAAKCPNCGGPRE